MSATYKGMISYPAACAKGSVRLLTPLTPRSRSFASPVTTPVYSTAVSKALRQPLGGKGLNNIDPHQVPTRTWGWHRVCGGGDTLHRHYSVDLLREQAHNISRDHQEEGGPRKEEKESRGTPSTL
jgi:hypothetical protein